MAKIFIVLSILASIAAGYFGYTTYQKVGDVGNKLKETKATLATTAAKLSTTQDKLTDTTNTLTKTTADLGVANETIKTTQSKLDDANTQLATAQASVADLTDKLAKETALYVAVSGSGGKPAVGTPEEEWQHKITDLQAQLGESQQLAKTLQAKADDAEHRLADRVKVDNAHIALINRPGIEGLVMAVNPGYNFTVISIGD